MNDDQIENKVVYSLFMFITIQSIVDIINAM